MTEERIPDGALARVTETHESLSGWVYKGTIFRVDGFYEEEAVGEDTPPLPASYFGSSLDGFEMYEPDAEYVELYRNAEDAKDIRIPTREEVAKAVSSAIMGIWDEPFSVHTGEKPDPDGTDFEARTEEGLEFAFTVKIVAVEGASW